MKYHLIPFIMVIIKKAKQTADKNVHRGNGPLHTASVAYNLLSLRGKRCGSSSWGLRQN